MSSRLATSTLLEAAFQSPYSTTMGGLLPHCAPMRNASGLSQAMTMKLVPPVAIHHILQRTAGLEARNLPRDIFRYLVGIGVGGIVRGQHHFWVGPERAVHRERLGGVDVERGATERGVVQASQDGGF